MSNYKFDTIVNRQEAEALKEMIFKRARERAEAMVNEAQDTYTSSVKNDVMDLARDSFVSGKNPFSIVKEETPKQEAPKQETQEVGFSKRHIDEIKAQINYRNKAAADDISNAEVAGAMADARADFGQRTSFMGALNFLNAQASITLVNKKGKRFEALA